MRNLNSIIWDWNGTLLNDVDICIDTINYSLTRRHLPKLELDHYKEIFTFPVIDYYRQAGFDFSTDSFDDLSVEFIDLYMKKLKEAQLFTHARSVIQKFHQLGFKQYILSAMEQNALASSVEHFGIDKYFRNIKGGGDIYAYGKIENGRELIRESGLELTGTCLIGDTLHDLEVAGELGCKCLLVANGHQSYNRLQQNHSIIVKEIKEVWTHCKPV